MKIVFKILSIVSFIILLVIFIFCCLIRMLVEAINTKGFLEF